MKRKNKIKYLPIQNTIQNEGMNILGGHTFYTNASPECANETKGYIIQPLESSQVENLVHGLKKKIHTFST